MVDPTKKPVRQGQGFFFQVNSCNFGGIRAPSNFGSKICIRQLSEETLFLEGRVREINDLNTNGSVNEQV